MVASQKQRTSLRFSRQGTGPAVLFLHGIPTSRHIWDRVVRKLQQDFTCITVDLPGFGESPPLEKGLLDQEHYAQELEILREQLSISSWYVVGHDAGSTIAVHYATQFSERVQKLVLCSPPIFPEFQVPRVFRLIRIPVLGDCLAPPATALMWSLGIPWLIGRRDRAITNIVQTFRRPFKGFRGVRRFVHLMRWGNPAQVLAKTAALLPKISMPTLILHGAKDNAIPVYFSIRAQAIIPRAELHLLDYGHFLPLSCPEVLCDYILPFLRETLAS